MVAFLVDALGSALVAGLFTAPRLPGNWALLAFARDHRASRSSLFGQTPGMRLLGLRLAHPRPGRGWRCGGPSSGRRCCACCVPALLVDADGRGLHDRLTDTAVVR